MNTALQLLFVLPALALTTAPAIADQAAPDMPDKPAAGQAQPAPGVDQPHRIIRSGPALVRGAKGRSAVGLKAFPAPEKGMTRHVLTLPKLDEENAFKVELIIGKTMKVEPHNHYFLSGKIESEAIKGWGYTRYIVRKIGPMASTLRGRVGPAVKEEKFIAIGGEPFLVRYNSRLPIVVYVPEGVEVKYRIWSANERTHQMEEG